MSDSESDDIIDWEVTPRDELRFALDLEEKDLAGTPMSREIAIVVRKRPTQFRSVYRRTPISHEIVIVVRGLPPDPKFTAQEEHGCLENPV
jgi:hypothetical protein